MSASVAKTALTGHRVDRDRFAVQPQGGTTCRIDAVGSLTDPNHKCSNDCRRADPAMNGVAGAEGNKLAGSPNANGGDVCRAARVTVAPASTGAHHIMLEPRGNRTGTYTLTVAGTP